jgi:hypothetical protein
MKKYDSSSPPSARSRILFLALTILFEAKASGGGVQLLVEHVTSFRASSCSL